MYEGQWRRNMEGKGAAALSISLNYSSKDPFLPFQYFNILVLVYPKFALILQLNQHELTLIYP